MRSSRQMWQLARTSRVAYLHFLQPSQYVPGSKVLTAKEKRRAIREQSIAEIAVERGYPMLRDAGRKLRGASTTECDCRSC